MVFTESFILPISFLLLKSLFFEISIPVYAFYLNMKSLKYTNQYLRSHDERKLYPIISYLIIFCLPENDVNFLLLLTRWRDGG